MSKRKVSHQALQLCISFLFYLGFVGLYVNSFYSIWVRRAFLIDFTIGDAGIFEYKFLYWPVIALGMAVLLSFLLLVWWRVGRKVMYCSHILLGMIALAYCGNVWADVDQNFNLVYSETWSKSGAELGPGYFLFFASVICLIFGGLCSLMICFEE